MHELSTQPQPEEKMVDFLKIDGIVYQIPEEPPASWALQMLEKLRQEGEQSAGLFVFELALGHEGYQQLLKSNLTFQQLTDISDELKVRIMGKAEPAIKKS